MSNMTIYLDIVFFINLAADFMIYFTSAVLLGIRVKKLRIVLTSVAAALYGTTAVVCSVLTNVALANIFSILTILMIFGKCDIYAFLKRLFVFYAVCIFTSGICTFASFGVKDLMVIYSGAVFFPADDLVFFIALISAFCLMKVLKYFLKKPKLYYKIILKSGIKSIPAVAYYDTGNRLTDPVSGLPVIIISSEIADKLENNSYITLMCNTVSDNYTIRAIHIDEIYFCDENRAITNILAGILLKNDKDFDVLLHNRVHP